MKGIFKGIVGYSLIVLLAFSLCWGVVDISCHIYDFFKPTKNEYKTGVFDKNFNIVGTISVLGVQSVRNLYKYCADGDDLGKLRFSERDGSGVGVFQCFDDIEYRKGKY